MKFIVDQYEIIRIPCKHAMLCAGYTRGNLEELCGDCYTIEKYLKVYTCVIHPLYDNNLNPTNNDENLRSLSLKRYPGGDAG